MTLKTQEAKSNENILHYVLGLLDVETRACQPSLDIFDGCRGGVARTLVRAGDAPHPR
jgi:hypothetical protein